MFFGYTNRYTFLGFDMDLDNILNMITETLSSITAAIPPQIAGIDTLYIGLGLVGVIVLLWGISKARNSKPKRELADLMPEEVDEESLEDSSSEASEEINEEDGFMPSNITSEPEEVKLSEPASEVKLKSEPEVEPVAVEPSQPKVARSSNVQRKKRATQRDGKKIVKGDFADFSGQRLLIAEDNLINQKVINGVLNESGIDVVMADDGQFVLDILEKDSDFEIVLMDAHMPRVDGFEATRMIRENPAYDHIAVVALSGDTASDDIRHMREAGMEEHLEKPLKMDALYDIMSMYYSVNEDQDEVAPEAQPELEIQIDVNELATLDYDAGLEICGDDEVMYKELLKEFFVTYKDSSKRMHASLVAKDYAEAKNILIDVKGTSSNMGAKQFIYTVDAFLVALSEENKKLYGPLFKDYQAHLLALLKSIQIAFKS